MKKFLYVMCVFIGILSIIACGKESSDVSDGSLPTLRILTSPVGGKNPNTDFLAPQIEELTGYKVEYHTITDDWSKVPEKLNLLMASGEKYDIVTGYLKPYMGQMVENGFMIPIDDLLNEYGANITANTDQKWFDEMVSSVDGKMYAVPIKRTSPHINHTYAYRKDIFDKHGIEIPQSTEELRVALQTIKDKENIIPLTLYDLKNEEVILSAFGMSTAKWYEVDGALVPKEKMPQYRDYLEYMASLYKDGLIDVDLPSNTPETIKTKFASGQAAICAWSWSYWPTLAGVRTLDGAEVGYLQHLPDSTGKRHAKAFGTTVDKISMIPKSSKNPEHAIKFLDALSKSENFEAIFIGEEGVHYVEENGAFLATETFAEEKVNSHMFYMANNEGLREKAEQVGLRGENPDVYEVFAGMSGGSDMPWVAYTEIDPADSMLIPATVAKYHDFLEQLTVDFSMQVIVGVKSIDEFDSFMQQWEREGGVESIQAMNEAYNR